jgi:tRNA threonylcarbamoyladenosine biosynthesis protein TsaE
MKTEWRTKTEQETLDCGAKLAQTLKPGMSVALVGELGSGKTTLVKGIARGLGLHDTQEVKSPTFVILHIYKTCPPLHHFDFYRLDAKSNLDEIGVQDFISDPNAISVVEWADRIPQVLEDADLLLDLEATDASSRTIKVASYEPGTQSTRR